jgi:hypothetical protein
MPKLIALLIHLFGKPKPHFTQAECDFWKNWYDDQIRRAAQRAEDGKWFHRWTERFGDDGACEGQRLDVSV